MVLKQLLEENVKVSLCVLGYIWNQKYKWQKNKQMTSLETFLPLDSFSSIIKVKIYFLQRIHLGF